MKSEKRKIRKILIFAVLFTVLAFVSVGCASAAVIYVPDDYAKIQWAVDNATAGDIIIVRDGTYSENVNVDKQLTIRSENGSASTTVQASYSADHVFEVTVDYVSISGFTVTGATGYTTAGIYLSQVDYCNISDNNASNNQGGIHLDSSSNNMLQSNIASNNYFGICLDFSWNNNLTNNNASNNFYGIHLYYSNNNTLTNNTASLNAFPCIWLDWLGNSCNNLIYNNYFDNTNNAYDWGNNIWNIAKTEGTNIIGGPYLGGNYWSDYTGEDLDGDGLGDTLLPYNCSGDIQNGGDYLPLVSIEKVCGDVNCNDVVNMGDVTLLLNYVAYGSDEYPICDEWAGDVNCMGGINMGDVTLLLNHVGYGGEEYPLNCC